MGKDAAQSFFGRLYRTAGEPLDLGEDELARLPAGDDVLAWIDLHGAPAPQLDAACDALGVPQAARRFLEGGTTPDVAQSGDYFWLRCVVPIAGGDVAKQAGRVLVCVAGPNVLLTIHGDAIPFLDDMKEGNNGWAPIGNLRSESFVAALLDRHLVSYFEAVSDYELEIERLEMELLGMNVRDSLPELQRLRRGASRLRRMLAPHRTVFAMMARPDFRPHEGADADRHFVALDMRFERAMDMVEHARELVIGSFELFSSQIGLRTNDAMRTLTFVTVITGLLATVVGALGMNFEASFFRTNDAGFWLATGGLAILALGALLIGRRRGWL